MAWNPGYHPRDKKGRFTRSSTRTMTAADKNRGRKAMEGFTPVGHTDAGAARDYLERIDTGVPPGAVLDYLDGDWQATNTALRAGKTPAGVDDIDQAMRPLPDDLMLRRQVPLSLFAGVPMKELEGRKVRDAAYASTTLDLPGQEPGGPDVVTMHIAAPTGTPALVNAADGEVLLARDTEVAISRVEPDGVGGWDVYGVVLPKVKPRAKKPGPSSTPAKPKTKTGPAKKATPVGPEPDPAAQPADITPAPLSYDDRVAAAVAGRAALTSVPFSLVRTETHARLGNRKGLSAESRDALIAYREHDYARINGQLRDAGKNLDPVDDPEADQWIRQIDTAMTASPLPGDVVTWRGLRTGRGIFGDRLEGDLTGMEWREDAYVSSSADRDIAEGFAGSRGVLMRVLTPAGVGAVQVSGMGDDAGHESEAEILIEHGVGVRVVADRGIDANRIRHLDVEMLKEVPSGVDR